MNINLEYSAWWLLGILFISLFLSWFSYRNKNGFTSLSALWKSCLYTLRFLSIFLISITLLGLFFKSFKERVEPPLFFVVTDNSASMLNYKDSNTVANDVEALRLELENKFGSQFDLKNLTIGTTTSDTSTYQFNEVNSNLEEVFEYIHSEYYNRNLGGIAFISDGNFNVGANPIYMADKMRTTPIFAIAVGDSIQKKDQLIRSVFNNPLAFFKNDFPVEIDVASYQLPNEDVLLAIYKKGKLVASQSLVYGNESEDFQKIRFLLPADELGYQTYTIKIENKPNEISYKNNTKNFYVEVLDSRNKILLLSTAPHPDISAIHNVLSADENIEFESTLFNKWTGEMNDINLLICHTPQKNSDLETINKFRLKNIPVLYILGASSHKSLYNQLGISFENNTRNQSDDMQGAVNDNFSAFVINPLLKESLNYYPPLNGKYGDFKTPTGATVLLKQRIGTVIKNTPLMYFMLQRGKRYSVLLGEGIWKWRINEYQRTKNHEVFNGFINKSIQYLTIPTKSQGLSIRFPKKINKEEDLVINGVFYNSSLEAITIPLLELNITDETGKEYNSQFSIYENGYKAQLGKLNPGKYTWLAQTTFDNKDYTKKGTFIVEDIDIEKSESVANHSVLKQLAKQNKGGFYKLSNRNSFINDLANRNEIKSVSFMEDTDYKLIDYTWYLIACALLLSGEWFFKRILGIS